MASSEAHPDTSLIGRRIGQYRLDEEIGRGGMGAVYRAVRIDGEFEQTVAIKLIKRGMDTDAILRRFRRERQILASLNHPNIGFFLGGGSTDDGLPYFIMEFIDGLPLYRYCRENRSTIRERLMIFRQVCWAAAAAHKLQIVHRDIKPSNIVVDRSGKPKLLDFGIAKALDPEFLATEGEPTAADMPVMTPQYASPEQAGGDTVTASSDIYSLGIILYELVTGHRPYTFSNRAPHDIARVIREEVPTDPSGAITGQHDLLQEAGPDTSLADIFGLRRATAEELKREISGDLEKVIMKALRKDPAERYRTATDFADDITNYLEARPVTAEQPVTFRTAGFDLGIVKRSIAILPFEVLRSDDTGEDFVGVGLADALISRLSTVRRLIVRPTTSVLAFAHSASVSAAEMLGVDYVLDGNVRVVGSRIRVSVQLYNSTTRTTEWAKAFDRDLGDVLELEDSIAEEVSNAVLPRLTAEEKNRLGKRGTDDPEAYECYLRGRYFWSKFSDEGLQQAVKEFQRAIELDPNYALPYIGLADYYAWAAIFGEITTAEGFPRSAEAARRALEIDNTLGEAYAALGFAVFLYEWNWAEAERLFKQALEWNPNYSAAHEFYSNFLIAQGRFEDGLREIRIAEELDPVSPRAILMTAWSLYQTRNYAESVEKARKALSMQEDLPQALLHLGNALTAVGGYNEAVSVLRKSAERWGRSGLPRYMLAFARAGQGKIDAVRSIIGKMEDTERASGMKPYFLAMAYVAAGDHDKAFEYFRRAVSERNEWLMWFSSEPKLDPIRSDERYLSILRATGNPIVASGDQPADPITTGSGERAIAVLPFRSLTQPSESAASGEQYLGIGIADAVTMRLSNVRHFIVRPTSSVLPFSSTQRDPIDIGKELGVDFVVDGIIRHIGSTIRVTAQLLDVAEGSTRWSASFSEQFADVLELEDSIADQVSLNLMPKLTGEDRQIISKRGTNNAEAHDAYLQGRYFWNRFTPDSFPKSLAQFERAIELDPDYALAHVGIADYYTWATIYGMLRPSESIEQVRRYAAKAIELDPDLAEGYAAMGLYMSNSQRWPEAEEYYRRALALSPRYALAHEWLSSTLIGSKRFDEGLHHLNEAERLNPIGLRSKVLSAWTIYQTRDFNLARAKGEELLTWNADFMQSHLQLANVLTVTGPASAAVEHSLRAMELEPDSSLPVYNACFALVAAGREREAVELMAKWEEKARTVYVPPYFLALCNVAIGRFDKAVDLLESAAAEFSPWIIWLGTEPKLDVIRDDPRFRDLMERLRPANP